MLKMTRKPTHPGKIVKEDYLSPLSFSVGQGDYTKERDSWLNDISINDAIAQIKAPPTHKKPQLFSDILCQAVFCR